MRTTLCMTLLIASFTASVFAGIGETKEEVIKRYGEPYWAGVPSATRSPSLRSARSIGSTFPEGSTNIVQALYRKEEPYFWVMFFPNKEGKSIAGEFTYVLPSELAQDKILADSIVSKLLDAHVDGQTWTEDAEDGQDKRLKRTFRREGATAVLEFGRQLTITLEEYAVFAGAERKRFEVFAEAERKRLAVEQAERIGRNLQK